MSDFSSKIDDLFADGLSDEAIAGVLAQEDPDNFEKVVGLLRRRSAATSDRVHADGPEPIPGSGPDLRDGRQSEEAVQALRDQGAPDALVD